MHKFVWRVLAGANTGVRALPHYLNAKQSTLSASHPKSPHICTAAQIQFNIFPHHQFVCQTWVESELFWCKTTPSISLTCMAVSHMSIFILSCLRQEMYTVKRARVRYLNAKNSLYLKPWVTTHNPNLYLQLSFSNSSQTILFGPCSIEHP